MYPHPVTIVNVISAAVTSRASSYIPVFCTVECYFVQGDGTLSGSEDVSDLEESASGGDKIFPENRRREIE